MRSSISNIRRSPSSIHEVAVARFNSFCLFPMFTMRSFKHHFPLSICVDFSTSILLPVVSNHCDTFSCGCVLLWFKVLFLPSLVFVPCLGSFKPTLTCLGCSTLRILHLISHIPTSLASVSFPFRAPPPVASLPSLHPHSS